jgi:hypothetical protein
VREQGRKRTSSRIWGAGRCAGDFAARKSAAAGGVWEVEEWGWSLGFGIYIYSRPVGQGNRLPNHHRPESIMYYWPFCPRCLSINRPKTLSNDKSFLHFNKLIMKMNLSCRPGI